MLDNQELLVLVIISFILLPIIFDSRVILCREIRGHSLLGVTNYKDREGSLLTELSTTWLRNLNNVNNN